MARGILSDTDYRLLAEFRFLLRQFHSFSEKAAAGAGVSPQQHQALLAIKGFAGKPTIGDLADLLLIRPHSAVGLVNRLARARLLRRIAGQKDHRLVFLVLTPRAEKMLEALSAAHRDELRRLAPLLGPLLAQLPG